MNEQTNGEDDAMSREDAHPDGDFLRGGQSVTAAQTPGSKTDLSGVVPAGRERPHGGALIVIASGILFATLVAWTTWASPAYGIGVATLAAVGAGVATAISYKLGVTAGTSNP